MAEKKTTMAEKKTTRGGRTGGSSGGKPKPTLERGMGKNDVTRAYLNSDGPPKIKTTGRSGGSSPGKSLVPYKEKTPTTSGGRPKPLATGGSASRTPIATGAKKAVTQAARLGGRVAGAVGLALTPNNNLAADADKPRGNQGWSGPAPESTTKPKSTPKPKSSAPKSSAPKSSAPKSTGYSQSTKDWAWAERERMLMQNAQRAIKTRGK